MVYSRIVLEEVGTTRPDNRVVWHYNVETRLPDTDWLIRGAGAEYGRENAEKQARHMLKAPVLFDAQFIGIVG